MLRFHASALALLFALLPARPARADDAPVLLLVPSARRDELAQALRIEMAARRLDVAAQDPPAGAGPLERCAQAQQVARQAGARAAVWFEPTNLTVRAVGPEREEVRSAPLSPGLEQVAPRVFALVAASLLDELFAPPEPPGTFHVDLHITARPPPVAAAPVAVAAPPAAVPVPQIVARPLATPATGTPAASPPVLPVGVDLAPFVGTSSFTRGREVRRFSLNLAAGLAHGLAGLEVAGAVNLETGFVHGLQVAGALNLDLGNLLGVQVAGAMNQAAAVHGLQVAGALDLATGPVHGAQVGGVNLALAGLAGLQTGGVNLLAGDLRGLQVGGVNLVAGSVRGLQVGGVNLAAGAVHGTQIGGVNLAAGEVYGVMIGAVNVAPRARFALGAVNIFWRGRTNLLLTGDEWGAVSIAVKHGVDAFHYIYSAEMRPLAGAPSYGFGLGLGGRAHLGGRVFVDVDLVSRVLPGDHDAISVNSLRVLVGLQLVRGLALVLGPTYSVQVDHLPLDRQPRHFLEVSSDTGGAIVRGWPGLMAGLQVF